MGRDTRSPLWSVMLAEGMVIAGALAAGLSAGNVSKHFAEGELVTWFSGLLLVATGWVSFRIYQARRPSAQGLWWRAPQAIWALMAIGFAFLAADDLFRLHERMDRLVHRLLRMEPTWLTAHLDDALVALYGVVGLAVLIACRREVTRCLRVRPHLLAGFVVMFAMMAVDAMNKRHNDLFPWLPGLTDVDQVTHIHKWLTALEDSLKVIAEGLFLVAFLVARQRAEAAAEPAP